MFTPNFAVYGSKKTFEWTQIENEDPIVHSSEQLARVKVPDYAHLLPEEIRCFTTKGVYDADEAQHLSFIQGSGHEVRRPHLARHDSTAILQMRSAVIRDGNNNGGRTGEGQGTRKSLLEVIRLLAEMAPDERDALVELLKALV